MGKRVNISKKIIEQAFNEGWHDSLYYYIKIKTLYRNPIIYNYSYRKISRLTGVSTSVLSKHIKVLLNNKLAHIRNGHLCFYSQDNVIQNFKKNEKVIINLPVHKEKRKMIDELRGVVAVRCLDNQIIRIFKNSEIVKKCKIADAVIFPKEIKALRKAGGSQQMEKNINRRITLSNKGFGKLFNRSQSSGKLYQRRLNTLGVIKSKEKVIIINDKFHSEMLRDRHRSFFRTKNNELAQQLSNTIWSPYMKSYNFLLENESTIDYKYNSTNINNNTNNIRLKTFPLTPSIK